MTATTTLKLDEELKDRVRRLAESQRRTPHWLMREAIADYVARAERRETFKQEALESLRQYRDEGFHLTGDEVDAWLETWGTERETEVPPCRKSS
jgi:predicted transcriptional regulator